MATRYRIRKTEEPAVKPTKKGSWSNSAFRWRRLETGAYDSSGLGLATSEVAETSSAAIYNILMSAVTDMLAAQTLSGTVSMQYQFKETDAAANMFARVGIYLIDGAGDLKSTLLAQTTDNTEFVTAYTNRTVLASVALSSQSCAAGDRIVVETGYYANNTKTTSYTGGVAYGADSSLSDLPVNDSTTGNYLGWIEFSQDHTFLPQPTIETITEDAVAFSGATVTLEFRGACGEGTTLEYEVAIDKRSGVPDREYITNRTYSSSYALGTGGVIADDDYIYSCGNNVSSPYNAITRLSKSDYATESTLTLGTNTIYGIAQDESYLYISYYNSSTTAYGVIRATKATFTIDTTKQLGTGYAPAKILVLGDYLYVPIKSGVIFKIGLADFETAATLNTGIAMYSVITHDDTHLWLGTYQGGVQFKLVKVLLSDFATYSSYETGASIGRYYLLGLAASGDKLFLAIENENRGVFSVNKSDGLTYVRREICASGDLYPTAVVAEGGYVYWSIGGISDQYVVMASIEAVKFSTDAFDLDTGSGTVSPGNATSGCGASSDQVFAFTYCASSVKKITVFGKAILRCSSVSDADFTNTETETDESPFNSGEIIRLTKQAAAFSEGTTHYYKARCRNGGGAGLWSEPSGIQSFTVSSGGPITIEPPVAAAMVAALAPFIRPMPPAASIAMTPMPVTYDAAGIAFAYPPTADATLAPLNPIINVHFLVVQVPAVTITMQGNIPTVDVGLTRIRQEINMLCHILSATSGNDATSNEIVQLDDDYYPDGTFYFEVVGYTSSSLAVDIKLRRKGTSTDDATCSIPAGTTAPRVFRSASFTPQTTETEYVVYIPNTSGATKYVVSARIVIVQKAPSIAMTESQYEIGNYETGKTNTTVAPLTYPKYFRQSYSDRGSAGWVYGEAVYKSSGGAVTITLQVDDGAFGGWTDVMRIVNAGTATSATRVRSWLMINTTTYFQPAEGKHYRIAAYCASGTYDIYCAKFIYRQGTLGQRYIENCERIDSVAVGSDGRVMVVGARGVGVCKSQNYGDSWVNVKAYTTAAFVCISDSGQHIGYAQQVVFENDQHGISNDYGQTWTMHPELPTYYTSGIVCSTSGQYFFIMTRQVTGQSYGRLYRSNNYGVSFESLGNINGEWATLRPVFCSDTGQYVAYGLIVDGSLIIKYSSDYGDTFSELNPFPDKTPIFLSFYDMSRDGTHLFIRYYESDYVEIHKVSHDRGASWANFPSWRPSGYDSVGHRWFESNDIWWAQFNNGWTYAKIYRSTDSGATWTKIMPPEDDVTGGNLGFGLAFAGASIDGNTVLLGSGSQSWPAVWRKVVNKMRGEYLLENTYNNTAGLADHDVKWEPSDWGLLENVTFTHVIDTSSDASDSAKLQTDPNGTPADITNSTATGANRAVSLSLTMPETPATIDVNVLNTPIYASRIIAKYAPAIPMTVDTVAMTLTALEPIIYPMKTPVPAAAMTLTALAPTGVIPPQIFNYPPTASMQLNARTVHHSWDVDADAALTAQSIYLCTLTGDNDGVSDINLPLSCFNAKLTDVFESYVLCVVPDVVTYESEIVERKNGEIVIFSGYRTASGEELVEEIFRVPLASIAIAKGGRSETITIFGWGVVPVGTPKERTARGVERVTKQANGKRVIISEIDLFLRCGDVFIYGTGGNDYIQVGAIKYEADAPSSTTAMTVTEL